MISNALKSFNIFLENNPRFKVYFPQGLLIFFLLVFFIDHKIFKVELNQLKRNPSLYFTIQSVLSAQVSDKLVSSSKKDD